ncbi:MAG: hypothetical protein JWL77_420 [Chthonomonadaceae bacterium]|nr:hypothetical protein [Chthonomonadaceae bacterium]
MTQPQPQSGPTVREARDRFLAAYALGRSTYTDTRFTLHLGPWRIRLPNPGLLPLHDLHHVATGFGSGLTGEAEISAFELRTGWGNLLILALCVGAVLLGAVICPRRVWRSWLRSRGARGLYRRGRDYERLLDMTVTELRSHLGIPPEGLASPAALVPEARKSEETNHG